MIKYLEVLKHTPISIMGINFNYSLSAFKMDSIINSFKDPFQVGENLDIVPVSVDMAIRQPNSSGLILDTISLVQMIENGIKNNIKITFEHEKLRINNNFEVNGLDEDRDRIKFLLDDYNKLIDNNNYFINKIGDL